MSTALPYTSIILLLFGSLFLAGLISVKRAAAKDLDERLRTKLSGQIRIMSVTGLAIAAICTLVVLTQITFTVSTNSVLQQFDEAACLETPITEQYKIIVIQRRDGKEDISIADSHGEEELIWVEQYAAVGNYLIGVTDGDYFWLNQRTGGRRIFYEKDEFLQSLNRLGVSEIPKLLPVNTVCQTHQCQPCMKGTLSL